MPTLPNGSAKKTLTCPPTTSPSRTPKVQKETGSSPQLPSKREMLSSRSPAALCSQLLKPWKSLPWQGWHSQIKLSHRPLLFFLHWLCWWRGSRARNRGGGAYLDMLPLTYSIPLFFSYAELVLLKECQHTWVGVKKMMVNAVMQVYLYSSYVVDVGEKWEEGLASVYLCACCCLLLCCLLLVV